MTFNFNYAKPSARNLFFIAGPCVIESETLCKKIADRLASLSQRHRVDIIFKASFDKANRLSGSSFRGPGKKDGLRVLEKTKRQSGLPVLTDIHEPGQAKKAAQVVDVLQIPALLCRQTDLIVAAARTGKWINIKKGQFMAPADMKYALDKAGKKVWLTERGSCFGYNRLVVDFTGIPVMKQFKVPVVFDATHSVQTPGGGKGVSSGNRDLAIPLAKAALAMGADGLFFEVHPEPDKALCDGANSLRLKVFEQEMPRLIELFSMLRGL
ncbi:MAG: 3-deoxy-8-phosphooctulonate synthase [Chitinispirillaceae bacterium]|nr:3-deoxy-8-phosphooctulonate synthase [Chitinispirillaceae bacterium]